MAPLVVYLLYNHDDLSLGPHQLYKKLGAMVHVISPVLEGWRWANLGLDGQPV